MSLRKHRRVPKARSVRAINPYQDIVDHYKNDNVKYRGSQTIDNSITSIINKNLLWAIILLEFICITFFSVVYIWFVVSDDNKMLKIWIIGGLDDVLFRWTLFIIIASFSLLLCSMKKQVYYYYILWVLLAINSIWDGSDGLYWTFKRHQIIDYDNQIEGLTFYVSLAFQIFIISANLIVIVLSTLGTINLPVNYTPVTDFGKWVKTKQLKLQKRYRKKMKTNYEMNLKKSVSTKRKINNND